MSLIWENSFTSFLVLTLVLGGGAAWMTGRAVAGNWQSVTVALIYMGLLAPVVRFFHFALGDGTLLSVRFLMVDALWLMAVAALSWRMTRASQMTEQYPWLYERSSPLTWRPRG
jgi:hypothetical protein